MPPMPTDNNAAFYANLFNKDPKWETKYGTAYTNYNSASGTYTIRK